MFGAIRSFWVVFGIVWPPFGAAKWPLTTALQQFGAQMLTRRFLHSFYTRPKFGAHPDLCTQVRTSYSVLNFGPTAAAVAAVTCRVLVV